MNAIHSSALGAPRPPRTPAGPFQNKATRGGMRSNFVDVDSCSELSNDFITFNVSGQLFQVSNAELEKFPDSKLSLGKRDVFYDQLRKEYFIDRHRRTFEVIAGYINNGTLKLLVNDSIDYSGKYLLRPDDIPIDVFITELSFYNLGRETVEHFLKNEGMLRTPPPPKTDYHVRYRGRSETCGVRRVLNLVWELCEDPSSSAMARFYSITSVLLIFISIGIFCAETVPRVRCWGGCDQNHRKHHNTSKDDCVTFDIDCSNIPRWLMLMRSTEV